MAEPDWPYNLDDPVRAVHFILDRDCPYSDASRCPDEANARKVIAAYKVWVAARSAASES